MACERCSGGCGTTRSWSAWKPSATRKVLYAGDPEGKRHLEAAGLTVDDYDGKELPVDRLLIVGPGGGRKLAGDPIATIKWLADGGHLLGIGLDQDDVEAW